MCFYPLTFSSAAVGMWLCMLLLSSGKAPMKIILVRRMKWKNIVKNNAVLGVGASGILHQVFYIVLLSVNTHCSFKPSFIVE